ncbi:MAG: response regulator [Gloeobacteraceae cyanobacterium ES-bin-316]|nr:response regulator [Ferruginibacter sp.]
MQVAPINILLIDDDEINNFLSNELIKLYHPNIEIKSILFVEQALKELDEKIINKDPLPDIILVDINMPSLNGWDFMEAFEKMDTEATKNVRVYIYTSSIYYKDMEKVKNYKSVIKLISKPFTEQAIAEILDLR